MEKHTIHIGTSGWSYKHWRNKFYPQNLKIKDQFGYYAKKFTTVEINSTFYGVPSDETIINWGKKVPEDFVYVIKANRFITHLKKLRNPDEILLPFLHKMKLLGNKLGLILFQLPPSLNADLKLLEKFLQKLPLHQRFAFEFRHSSWYADDVYDLLRKYNAAFCIYELAGHISPLITTADFVYLRLHGPTANKYQGSYSDEALRKWAEQCKTWLKSDDVFVYFDNDEEGYAAFNALQLIELMK
ncbi:DUF72 domain-containing protein [Flavobacterium aestuarii]|uniref:DUF72 domain-containing protein n=1 Tax=Flavobacterium aestuarii TaxID=3149227 RepID=UPI0032B5487A